VNEHQNVKCIINKNNNQSRWTIGMKQINITFISVQNLKCLRNEQILHKHWSTLYPIPIYDDPSFLKTFGHQVPIIANHNISMLRCQKSNQKSKHSNSNLMNITSRTSSEGMNNWKSKILLIIKQDGTVWFTRTDNLDSKHQVHYLGRQWFCWGSNGTSSLPCSCVAILQIIWPRSSFWCAYFWVSSRG
jgi:hypothetical protein